MDTLIRSTAGSSGIPRGRGVSLDHQDLIPLLSRAKYNTPELLSAIRVMLNSGQLNMDQFPQVKNGYSRTILHREPCGFEVMVARWSKAAKTPIHGHPGYALIYVVEGELWEESFDYRLDCLETARSRRFKSGSYSLDQGIEGRFDNSIHQITAVSECLSLHVYSDDALKGKVYTV